MIGPAIGLFVVGGLLTGIIVDAAIFDMKADIKHYVFAFFMWFIVLPILIGYCIKIGYKDVAEKFKEMQE